MRVTHTIILLSLVATLTSTHAAAQYTAQIMCSQCSISVGCNTPCYNQWLNTEHCSNYACFPSGIDCLICSTADSCDKLCINGTQMSTCGDFTANCQVTSPSGPTSCKYAALKSEQLVATYCHFATEGPDAGCYDTRIKEEYRQTWVKYPGNCMDEIITVYKVGTESVPGRCPRVCLY